jgi:hypothetical protein
MCAGRLKGVVRQPGEGLPVVMSVVMHVLGSLCGAACLCVWLGLAGLASAATVPVVPGADVVSGLAEPGDGPPTGGRPVRDHRDPEQRAWRDGPAYAPGLVLNRRADRSASGLPEIAKAVLGIISGPGSAAARPGMVLVLSLERSGRHRIMRIELSSAQVRALGVASLPHDLPRFVQIATAPAGRLPTDPTRP